MVAKGCLTFVMIFIFVSCTYSALFLLFGALFLKCKMLNAKQKSEIMEGIIYIGKIRDLTGDALDSGSLRPNYRNLT